MFSFGHCPYYLQPPRPSGETENLVLFFGRQKRRFAFMTEQIPMMILSLSLNDGCNGNYDGNFDDNDDKNDHET